MVPNYHLTHSDRVADIQAISAYVINTSKSQFISTALAPSFFAPSLFCLYHPSPLFSGQLFLFHSNVAKMSPHWKPPLAPIVGLVALLCVHMVPCTFPTWHCIIITCFFSSFPTRLFLELCLGYETPKGCAHMKWKNSPTANWNIILPQTHITGLLSKVTMVRFNLVFFSYHYLQRSSVWLSFLALWWFLQADFKTLISFRYQNSTIWGHWKLQSKCKLESHIQFEVSSFYPAHIWHGG